MLRGVVFCKTAKPEFEKLGNSVTVNGKKVTIEKVNGDLDPERVKAAGVGGFPTIILENDGEKINFEGKRNHTSFMNFLKKNL